jgi:cytoplasmic tRNA 2-thiolation protein 2
MPVRAGSHSRISGLNVLTLVLRSCYIQFISTKAAKRLEGLQRSLRLPHSTRVKYLLGLSLGTSSTALLHMIERSVQRRLDKGSKGLIEVVVVHVEPDAGGKPESARDSLAHYRQRFPGFDFRSVPLSSTLNLQTIDWSALPLLSRDGNPDQRLTAFLDALPSSTSRQDVIRHFTHHILIAAAKKHQCHALLLGSSTTSLAELALSETAQGRGLSTPWSIDDGPIPTVQHPLNGSTAEPDSDASDQATGQVQVCYPLRDVFRRELVTYTTIIEPPLTDLLETGEGKQIASSVVVSHKDLSIQEVMARYFETVEEQYPSVVANVVKTTAKLQRGTVTSTCALCGMGLDPDGDEAWNGEMGDEGQGITPDKLCYGCRRTMAGT